ncbi:MAG: PSP1 domain-containing protein [Coriobacteriia bacterium]
MPTVVGVRLRYAGKVLYFDPAGSEPVEGDHVIVTTERGEEYGEVVAAPHEVAPSELPAGLKPVVRVADEVDIEKAAELASGEAHAMETFRRLVDKHKLDMKPIGVETLFDGSKMIFYFVAEERVDFRELVRELASAFKARIDMRQIGVRDEARLVGGLGHCGEQLCCVRFGGEFQPVSIRMAKEQDLPLNPLKISGLCGRLMCCLRYEYEAYKDFKQRAPKCGSIVETPTGKAKVTSLNTPRELVTMRTEDGTSMQVPLEALDCSGGHGCPCVLKQQVVEAEQNHHFDGPVPDMPLPAVGKSGTPNVVRSERPAAKSAAKPEAKAEGESTAEGSEQKRTSRRRRKRKPAGGGESSQAQPPKTAPEAAPKPTNGDTPASGGRRRRRRRSPGNGECDS